jgi:lipopolysaccharide/colanic/teichoic acid biosynthesis glycosyltransferase
MILENSPKRCFDLAICIAIAPFALIICCIVALPIWWESKSNPFFRQVRLGRNEQPFNIIKLRTMRSCTPIGASHEIGVSYILQTGRLIRILKIDELPQLWNVFRGEMSLVGPRPGLPSQLELTRARRDMGIFDLLPGITGTGQLEGLDMSTPDKLAKSDAKYLVDWSLMLDLNILFHTAIGKGLGDASRTTNR